jgi:hypothetical protein
MGPQKTNDAEELISDYISSFGIKGRIEAIQLIRGILSIYRWL